MLSIPSKPEILRELSTILLHLRLLVTFIRQSFIGSFIGYYANMGCFFTTLVIQKANRGKMSQGV